MKEDNKDIKLLKNKMWLKGTTAKITMLGRKTIIEECEILKEIQRNNT